MQKNTFKKRMLAAILTLAIMLTATTYFPVTVEAAGEVYGFGIATANVPVLDKSSRQQIGTIFSKEGCTIVDYTSYGDYYLINYSVSGGNGYKEGLVPKYRITAYPKSVCATIDRNYSVWYGPDASKFGTIGSLSAGERVAVLNQGNDGYWDYIEYNAAGGLRKRGYVPREYLQYNKSLDLKHSASIVPTIRSSKTFNIYAGPTDVYYKIETAYLTSSNYRYLKTFSVWGLDVACIEYTSPNDSITKQGYIINYK